MSRLILIFYGLACLTPQYMTSVISPELPKYPNATSIEYLRSSPTHHHSVHPSHAPLQTPSHTAPHAPISTTPHTAPHGSPSVSGYKNFVYFVNWAIYDRAYTVQMLPASQITHVLYSFWNIAANGTVFLSDPYADLVKLYPTDTKSAAGNDVFGSIKQLYIVKKHNRQLKTLMSVGGWTYSTNIAAAASSSATRAIFASDVVKFIQDLGFDGVDIDWEYPADETQAVNYVLLLAEVRRKLDEYAAQHAPGYHFLITVACPAGAVHYRKMHLAEMNAHIDTWNLMAYDYTGSWDKNTGHSSNLYPSSSNQISTPYNTQQAIKDYVSAGVQPSKIVMGIPLYGRSFLGTAGLGQPFTSVGGGSWEDGVWDYKVLPKSGATEKVDNETLSSYSYDSSAQTLISYDNTEIVRKKAQYIQSQGLGGAMFWEASGDKTGGESLIGTTASEFKNLDVMQNNLNYPASQYTNMAAGMPGE
ncbi:BgTH12-05198 [Blumeria graminis f. sp. triticale]|uniref:chitinase n=3 Tax=Blumeria graminis TaxID=34373 RepID=A0A9X9MH70_BLUGR|nr:Sporulation-specific chitinase [Blumeria graminis f. sp. tritici 96224]CAD6502607.1 BgTH12-05198 [Blumeria graminis f. sp. triticale]VDB88025.1 Bgt-1269 [Blumeria graminis f. sp. tritici]